MTARWVVNISEARNINVTWKPISLLIKNQPEPGSDYFAPVEKTHKMLRVMESVRAAEGDGPIQALYFEMGALIHHDKELDFEMADALEAVGLDPSHASALDDDSFDQAIQASMDDGLGLTGTDVGTPIIAKINSAGKRVAYFGPVITRAPEGEDALKLWDGLNMLMDVEGFWELKRTRTEGPEFGERP